MKPQALALAGLALALSLTCAAQADAQLLLRWFGPKTPDKNVPAKPNQPDAARATEINVEIAWLADPVTCPYYLEARVAGSKLEVRGYVPNKTVREHALRIAQVYSSLPVTDALREHASLTVKASQMTPQQLQNSAQSALKVALPKQYQQLKVECGADGKVFVLGAVNTLEDKMTVSNSLRRLHGCTSVQNLTLTQAETAPTPPRDKTPAVKTSNPSDRPTVAQDNKSKPWVNWPWTKNPPTQTAEPPLLEPRKPVAEKKQPIKPEGPVLIGNVPEPRVPVVAKEPAPTSKAPLTVAELQKRIRAACPQARGVEVQFMGNQEVRITVEIRAESEISPTAERLFAMPELQNYRPELQFKIAAP